MHTPERTSLQSETDPVCVYLAVFVYLVALNQQSLQAGDLISQFSDQPDVAVLVDGGFVDDVLGSVSVAQRAQRLSVVHIGGGNVCKKDI